MSREHPPLLPQIAAYRPFQAGVVVMLGLILFAALPPHVIPLAMIGGGMVGLMSGLMIAVFVSVIGWYVIVGTHVAKHHGIRGALEWAGPWTCVGMVAVTLMGLVVAERWLTETLAHLSWSGVGTTLVIGVMVWAALQDPLRDAPITVG